MADLALLNQELKDLRSEREEMRAKHQGATMPEEARERDREIADRVKRLTFLVEEEQQKERDKLFENTAKYLDEPRYQINRAVNPDDESRRVMAKAGWETKGGFVTRMTSTGQEIAMYPEEVMFGALPGPEDHDASAYMRQTRAIMQPEYRTAYAKWLKARGQNDSLALSRLSAAEQNALSEGSDGAGGFLVPPDVQAEILARTAQMAVMRRLARVVPTSRDVLRFPAVAAATTNSSIYSSGFVGGWVGETPAFSETDPAFQQFDINVKKLRVATKLSNDFIADAAANVLAFLASNGGENMALVEDNGFIAGTGASNQPLGILNVTGAGTLVASGGIAVDVEGTTANTISNASGAGSSNKVINLAYALPAQYASGASWLMSRAIEGKTFGLMDSSGRPVWTPQAASGLANPAPNSLLGAPIYNSDWVPSDGTDANKVYVFGNFNNYIIAQRTGISTVVLRERFADTDQTGIILFERVGGGVWNTDAFRIGIV